MKNTFSILAVLFLFLVQANSQLGRDIALQFLRLDKDSNYLLGTSELKHLLDHQGPEKFFTLDHFKKHLYPKQLWKDFDEDKDKKLSASQLSKMIKQKWAKYDELWQSQTLNNLALLNQQQYLRACDENKDNNLQQSQFPKCYQAILTMDDQDYPYKIKSILYKNKASGYDFEEFKKLIQKGNAQGQPLEQYTKKLFDSLQWKKQHVEGDHDELIGPDEGKIMQPIFMMIHLDRNNDGELSKEEVRMFVRRFGTGDKKQQSHEDKVIGIMDQDKNNKIDGKQFIAYYSYASCIGCDQMQQQNEEKSQEKKQEKKQQKKQEKSREEL